MELRTKRHPIYFISNHDLIITIVNSKTFKECLEKLEVPLTSYSYVLLNRRIQEENIDISHILKARIEVQTEKLRESITPLEEVLIENSFYRRRSVKKRLLEKGILENKCQECGLLPEWNGKPISLQLDHINGISNDHRIENLRILCPNCHSQTLTFAGKSSHKSMEANNDR